MQGGGTPSTTHQTSPKTMRATQPPRTVRITEGSFGTRWVARERGAGWSLPVCKTNASQVTWTRRPCVHWRTRPSLYHHHNHPTPPTPTPTHPVSVVSPTWHKRVRRQRAFAKRANASSKGTAWHIDRNVAIFDDTRYRTPSIVFLHHRLRDRDVSPKRHRTSTSNTPSHHPP